MPRNDPPPTFPVRGVAGGWRDAWVDPDDRAELRAWTEDAAPAHDASGVLGPGVADRNVREATALCRAEIACWPLEVGQRLVLFEDGWTAGDVGHLCPELLHQWLH